MKEEVNIFWFRRDLRIEDNVGLAKASMGKTKVVPIFIFDPEILNELPEDDARVTFIHDRLQSLSEAFKEKGTDIAVYYDTPLNAFTSLTNTYSVQNVITNRDYEPYALKRDKEIAEFLDTKGAGFHTFKDQVIFEQNEVVKADGNPYTVYTPYMRKWKARLKEHPIPSEPLGVNFDNFLQNATLPKVTLEQMGFTRSTISIKPFSFTKEIIADYDAKRNFPAVNGTTNLSPHLRFGTVSVRELVRRLLTLNDEKLLNELIWREFFMQILWHFPHTVHKAFKPKYDRVPWRKSPEDLEAWKAGQTGYPIVDAGMRELNETGYMHNRVRMIVASFLLLIQQFHQLVARRGCHTQWIIIVVIVEQQGNYLEEWDFFNCRNIIRRST